MKSGREVDLNFETWSQMDCRRPNHSNILLHQAYVQHGNKPHISPDILVMVEEGPAVRSELHVLGNVRHRVESRNG